MVVDGKFVASPAASVANVLLVLPEKEKSAVNLSAVGPLP